MTGNINIEKIINEAFAKVRYAYYKAKGEHSDDKECTQLVFPRYRDKDDDVKGEIRVSEQEFRFAFVEAFNEVTKGTNFTYSIETPTRDTYLFSEGITSAERKLNDKLPCITEYGESANIDLVVYKEDEIVALIEFKCGTPKLEDYEKDMVKLTNEKESDEHAQRYFLQLLETSKDETITSIRNKRLDVLAQKQKSDKNVRAVNYRCYSLNHKGEKQEQPIHKRVFKFSIPKAQQLNIIAL